MQLYYSSLPRLTNTRQPSTGRTSSLLGLVRYLTDGTEQCLLAPRKDTAALYQAQTELLTPYAYDAYGAQAAHAVSPARLVRRFPEG